LSMLLLTCNDALAKYLTQSYPVLQVLWLRAIGFCIFTLLLIWRRRGGLRTVLRSQRPGLQLLRAGSMVLQMAVVMVSFWLLPLAEVTALLSAAPLVVAALAAPLLGERVGWHRWTGVLVGFCGVLLIVRPGGDLFGWPALLPLAGATLWGLYQIQVRIVSRHDSSDTTLLYTGLVVLAAFTVVAPWHWVDPAPLDWLWLLLLGLINSGAHYCMIDALGRAPASLLQPFVYSGIVWAALLGWLLFDDLPDGPSIAGMLLVAAGGLYVMYRERRTAAL
ncbi:MAG: DMT family transporter, partial [Candidatus Competibacterales bacterium]|nr:DMT family transporter [Candidatus Competibacterales bacterium]